MTDTEARRVEACTHDNDRWRIGGKCSNCGAVDQSRTDLLLPDAVLLARDQLPEGTVLVTVDDVARRLWASQHWRESVGDDLEGAGIRTLAEAKRLLGLVG